MYARFPLSQTPLDLAHSYWKAILSPGDLVIDATCGNGLDTLYLAGLIFKEGETGQLFAMDIQAIAIDKTRILLKDKLTSSALGRIHFLHASHIQFPSSIAPESVKLIVYNFGYLPGGDKTLTTLVNTSLESLRNALALLTAGGAISLTCYPGHEEGALEEKALLDFCADLDPRQWSCCHHRWVNRRRSPSLLFIQKNLGYQNG